MSKLLNELRARRSVRKYLDKQVPEELIREVLEAARWAPSAHNAQPWRFIVLADPQAKRRLAETMADTWASEAAKEGVYIEPKTFKLRVERFVNAPALVLACFCMDGMAKLPDDEKQRIERDLAMQSLAAAVQNMLLAAHSLGLGTCWFCAPSFCKQTVRETLEIPKEVEPEALIMLGYPAEEPAAPVRKPLDEYCFREKWGHSSG